MADKPPCRKLSRRPLDINVPCSHGRNSTRATLGKKKEEDGPMFVRMTFTKSDPATLDAVVPLYNSEEVSGVIGRQKGHRFHYLLQSVDEPTDYVSVTAWDSREDAEVYERSGTYEELTGKFMQSYTRPPRLRSYEVVGGE
jgi:heme-degrading monooxygenase HmoA